ncbi:DUF1643 domain-containing protein [Paracoccus sp. S-4012]|uniref:DUF1643 domain-containing protein n=1 Tax=Paracoccus sp. S-4012 TaxID=2665648 RepID=UPI0012B12A7D|nr:DUF1643 domain-containing protein [Paracoccus sp. S-4012]MRX51563.1 DUF1643 domain-containing protein [Paracoccus sp. S-4012]
MSCPAAAAHDPGGRVRYALAAETRAGAEFSACSRYRPRLWREWEVGGLTVLWVGMNPSTADAGFDDPTCRRECDFTRAWGGSRYLKGNVLDWRATRPQDLPRDPALACSPRNLEALTGMAGEADLVIAAHGRLHRRFHPVLREVLAALRDAAAKPVQRPAVNSDGSARHPLYLRAGLRPEAYDMGWIGL